MILMSLMSEMYPGLRREHDSEVGWRESYAKTNGFVAGDPEICHSHGGTSPALFGHFSGNSVRMPPRPPCAVISCYLLTLLETYQHSLLGKNQSGSILHGPPFGAPVAEGREWIPSATAFPAC